MKKGVVLLSGGVDSTTVIALMIEQGFIPYSLSIDYGQRHRVELRCAEAQSVRMGAREHKVVALDLRVFGGSALTASLDVPKDRPIEEMAHGIPITYVPARNTILLALALGYAETIEAYDIFMGVNVLDYSGYPDCRPEFLDAFAHLANLATRAGVEGRGKFRVHAPLLSMTKAQIIREGVRLGVDYALTSSCYDPNEAGLACGKCDACQLRRKGFIEAGIPDPTLYSVS